MFPTGVEVTNVAATVTTTTPIRVGDANNNINFNLQALSNPAGADISGSNLWLVDVFTSTQSDGSGVRYGQSQAVFTSGEGLSTALFGGQGMILSGGRVQVDLSSVQSCANQAEYLCFRLRRNPVSTPQYTLTGFPNEEALIDCVDYPCEGKWRTLLGS